VRHSHAGRAGLVAILTLFMFAIAPVVGAQDSTPADHEAHHAGTPASTQTPVATAMSGMGRGDSTPAMGALMAAEQFDLMFIDMMTLHHEGAVAMAEVALERGEHPEILQLAEEVIRAQEDEIAQLTTWRDAWYPDAPEMPMDQMMGDMDDMYGMTDMMGMMDPAMAANALRAAPEPFDLAFINAMIPHHLSALMMAEMAVQQAVHPELADAAQTMFALQEQEMAQMRGWRAEWYGTAATPGS
jgi:uncharacterized protein (DUF305 family)